jgi:hypothetical protein
VGELIDFTLSQPTDTYRFEVVLPPGEVATSHYHPGLLFVEVYEGTVAHTDTVVQGNMVVKRTQNFSAGESFFEAPFVVTDVANNSATVTARFAVSTIVERGVFPIVSAPFPDPVLPVCPPKK